MTTSSSLLARAIVIYAVISKDIVITVISRKTMQTEEKHTTLSQFELRSAITCLPLVLLLVFLFSIHL
jgi:hypothetical protein